MLRDIKNVDLFIILNVILFCAFCIIYYYERFLYYRGRANIHEFFIYALIIIILILIACYLLRNLHIPNRMLILLQIGILAHFAGGFVPIDGQRLYDAYIIGIGFDKYVHFYNSFVSAYLVNHLFKIFSVSSGHPGFRNLVLLMCVLGGGAVVEIVEYLVLLTVDDVGVGDYHNNMRDMIANLSGCMTFITLNGIVSKLWNRPL